MLAERWPRPRKIGTYCFLPFARTSIASQAVCEAILSLIARYRWKLAGSDRCKGEEENFEF